MASEFVSEWQACVCERKRCIPLSPKLTSAQGSDFSLRSSFGAVYTVHKCNVCLSVSVCDCVVI